METSGGITRQGLGRSALLGLVLGSAFFIGGAGATEPGAAKTVTTRTFSEVAIHPEVEAAATVTSLSDSEISAELNAKIVEVAVQPGDRVARGALLVRLDSSDLELAQKRAKANLLALDARRRLAKSQLERSLSLMEKNFVSREFVNQRQAEFEASTAEMLALQAEIDRIRRDIARTAVRAPFAGVVTARAAEVGEFARPGQPLVNLVDTERIEAVAKIQPAMLSSFRKADQFVFSSRGKRYPLRLRALTPVFDQRERSQEARFSFVGELASPGESGVVRWRSGEPHLPANLLVVRQGRLGVFVVRDGRARFVPLPSAEAGRPAPAELGAGTRVILEGRYSVNDGDPVR